MGRVFITSSDLAQYRKAPGFTTPAKAAKAYDFSFLEVMSMNFGGYAGQPIALT